MKTPSVWLALVLLSAFTSAPAFAQDDGLGVGPRGGSVFLEASAGSVGQGDGVIWGGSGGGYIQGHVLGFMARATALPGNANNKVYNAVIGPRLAVTLPLVRLFVEAGGGMGHSGYYNALGAYGTSWGAAWQADAGRVAWHSAAGGLADPRSGLRAHLCGDGSFAGDCEHGTDPASLVAAFPRSRLSYFNSPRLWRRRGGRRPPCGGCRLRCARC